MTSARVYNALVSSSEERALARANWVARLVSGSDPGEEGPHALSPDEAWLAVGHLTRSLWLLTGQAVANVPRAQWPARLFRRGEERDDGTEPP